MHPAMCHHCDYELTGLPAQGLCPECGKRYDTESAYRARRPEHKRERREAILAGARRLLDAEGVEGATLSAIARAAGLSKANCYRYFESREAILLAVILDEARAWLGTVEAGLAELDPGGLEVMEASLDAFAAALTSESHTLKRTLTDPRIFSGIGNAYSDEILHRARLSPITMTGKLNDAEIERLFDATKATLAHWIETLRAELAAGFPEKVTAFRAGMAAHGRYGEPCPDCGTAIQRIRYASNETNYCPRCQTGGQVLADRSLSRLLKGDWPRSIEELEQRKPSRGPRP